MQIRKSDWEKEVLIESFSIKLSLFPDALHVLITDTNPTIELPLIGAGVKERTGVNETTGFKETTTGFKETERMILQNKRACFHKRSFLVNIDYGTALSKHEDVCRHKTYHEHYCCCSDRDVTLNPHPQSFQEAQSEQEVQSLQEEHSNRDYEDTYEKKDKPPTGTFNLNEDNILVYGFSKLGNINRYTFHNVDYHFEVPLNNFRKGYNRFEIYLKDKGVNPHILISTGLKFEENTGDNGSTSEAATTEQIDHKIDSKADKSEINAINDRLDDIINEFIKSKNLHEKSDIKAVPGTSDETLKETTETKSLPENLPKPNTKGRTP